MDESKPIPPQGGEYIPPPLPPSYPMNADIPPPPPSSHPVTSDIPPGSPYHYSPAPPTRTNRGFLGGLGALLIAALAYGKYALLIIFKIPLLATFGGALISIAGYALGGGPWLA